MENFGQIKPFISFATTLYLGKKVNNIQCSLLPLYYLSPFEMHNFFACATERIVNYMNNALFETSLKKRQRRRANLMKYGMAASECSGT